MLHLVDVDVSLAGLRVLRQVCMDLTQGTTTLLVGRNGAGKTTTLRTIMGLLPLQGGKLVMENIDITEAPAHHRLKMGIGYAPEDRRLIAHFSVKENILIPAYARGLSAVERNKRLEEILSLLPEVADLLKRPGGNLSGGQSKMAALARALMAGSQVILLDEPFQGLAPALALQYARILSRIREHQPNLAILVTESSPGFLKDTLDTALRIERGEVTQIKDFTEIFA